MCATHGFVRDCGVSESGERVCQQCGNAVTGVTGSARSTRRSPPVDEPHATGAIKWWVRVRGRANVYVNAFDLQAAAVSAIDKVDDPQDIKEVKPHDHRFRASSV